MSTKANCIVTDTGRDPKHAVIWLHGLGADGHDFVPIVPELCAPNWPAIRFVFPHAPMRPVTINGGMRMRAWYDITTLDRSALGEAPGLRDSIATVGGLIQGLEAENIVSENIFIAGFSQGGAVALCAALRHPKPLSGVIALSTYLPLMDSLSSEMRAQNAKLPIFMAHGTHDPVVPLSLGQLSADALRARQLPLDWYSYPMQHSVCAEEIADLRQWMTGKLMT
jgi:phospholipase/carboxylesterase